MGVCVCVRACGRVCIYKYKILVPSLLYLQIIFIDINIVYDKIFDVSIHTFHWFLKAKTKYIKKSDILCLFLSFLVYETLATTGGGGILMVPPPPAGNPARAPRGQLNSLPKKNLTKLLGPAVDPAGTPGVREN